VNLRGIAIWLTVLYSVCLGGTPVSMGDTYALLVNGGYGDGNAYTFSVELAAMRATLAGHGVTSVVVDGNGPTNALGPYGDDNLPILWGTFGDHGADAQMFRAKWSPYQGWCYLAMYGVSPDGYGVDYAATPNGLYLAVRELQGVMTGQDDLIVYLIDHGGQATWFGTDTYEFGLWDQSTVDAIRLMDWLDRIPYDRRAVIVASCHASAIAPVAAKPGSRTVLLAQTRADELGWVLVPTVYERDGEKWWDERRVNWASYLEEALSLGGMSWSEVFDYAYERDLFGPVQGGVEGDVEHPQLYDPDGLAETWYLPEPAAACVLAAGALLLILRSRRRG